MRALARSVPPAFALANLYLLYLSGPLVSPEHQLLFHLPASATPLFLAVLANILLTTAVLAILLAVTRRHPQFHLLVWAALLLPLPCILVNTVADFAGTPAHPALLWLTALGGLLAWLGVATRRRALLPTFTRTLPGLRTLLGFVALSGVLILGQLLWLGWRTRGLNAPFTPRPSPPETANAATPPRRVVWIILDELSYRQVYGHRDPNLQLPNFDRLAREATVFPDAVAAGQYTRIALPSLLTGRAMSATSPTGDGRHLLLHPRGGHGWLPLRPQDTVFSDVAAMGLQTSIAGWYEPYCRVLPGVLDRCFWTYRDSIPGGMSPSFSVARKVAEPWREGLLRALHLVHLGPGIPSEGTLDVARHAADTRDLIAAGDHLLQQQNSGLILLHMPIPHPWGFYDRHAATFPAHRTSYLDNLALADAYLGHVRTLLEAQGAWDSTDLLVMGDHGWRVHTVWQRSGFWTPEDEHASHGTSVVDPPAVILKLHGQANAGTSSARFDATRTRALINALLAGRLRSDADLQSWLTAR